MVYMMRFYVDGGCRGNGQPNSIGAAACCLMQRDGGHLARRIALPRYPSPTNQRAEICAIILALEWVLEKYGQLDLQPRLVVQIHSDSRYAIGCIDTWIYDWVINGWINSAGDEVANRDLIQRASKLNDDVKKLGSVSYIWVPRDENQDADRCCNDKLNELEFMGITH
ncbi:ribonuclease H1 [Xylariaceae sp. AK1471]|nr:ribonuclease H1 [Xylariaceae sp. AK1471]